MKRIEDRQLARLGSVKDLQAAKGRVNRAIREMEESVKDDYEAALEAFSWRDVICYGFSVLDSVQSVVRYMGKGLYTSMTSGIVNGLRRRTGAGRIPAGKHRGYVHRTYPRCFPAFSVRRQSGAFTATLHLSG